MTAPNELLVSKATRYHLSTTFMWPLPHEEFNRSKSYFLKFSVVMFMSFATIFIPMCVTLHLSLKHNLDTSEVFGEMTSYMGMVTVLSTFTYEYKKILTLIIKICDFRNLGKPPKFDQLNKKLNFYVQFLSWYVFFGITLYTLMSFRNFFECKKNRNWFQICGTLIPLWVPWAPVDSLYMIFLHSIYLTAYTFLFAKASLLYSVQIFEFAQNIKIKIEHLNTLLKKCFDGCELSHKRKLYHCIRYHQHIISLGETLNDAFIKTTFAHILLAVVACGSITHQIIKRDVQALVHYGGWVFSIFVICFSGQTLIDSSLTVADAAFASNWINASCALRKDLIIIIRRSQKCLMMKAGLFNILNLATFVSILKLSYSVLTLMQS